MNLRRDVFQAIADPTRRAILVLLASQSMNAGAIASNFNSARPTISKHLQILTECELVKSQSQGREVRYILNAIKMRDIDIWLEQFRKLWELRFDQLDQVLSQMKPKKP